MCLHLRRSDYQTDCKTKEMISAILTCVIIPDIFTVSCTSDNLAIRQRMKRICVYCGSKAGNQAQYRDAAKSLGRAMTRRNIGLVYGGGSTGLMGQIAGSVMRNNGETIGVVPKDLFKDEVADQGLTELITVADLHQRKARMAGLADGFIALPGGFGTLEELFEAITWSQLKIHSKFKPVGLLNTGGYYDPLHDFICHAVSQGFIKPEHQALYTVHSSPDTLLDRMAEKI